MRVKVQKAILEGYRPDMVEDMIKKEYPKFAYKAKFLAQNETSIMLAELKKSMYTEMGFTEFIWQTILDGRERPEHHKLNGKIFSFDNPPEIDKRTGQRGLPGQTYNCRCNLIPIKRDSVFFDQATIDEFADLKSYKGLMKYGPTK
jgi:SPP1 gp7 family putative phage head morphogenesis protein